MKIIYAPKGRAGEYPYFGLWDCPECGAKDQELTSFGYEGEELTLTLACGHTKPAIIKADLRKEMG